MDTSKPAASSSAAPRRSFKAQYLILYNFVSAVLWTTVFGRVVLLVPLVGFTHVYGGVGNFAKWTQTLALLEVVHALFGIVRSPITTTGMQVASRLLLVWGIVNNFTRQTAPSVAYSTMLFAWSFTEIVRYSYFVAALGSGGSGVPKILTWLRYNTFYVLYPLGILSEVTLVYKSLGPAKEWGYIYEIILKSVLLIYIPGSYILYSHMMAQRRKVLRGKQRQT
ncbi:PTPLA-domain-containing protein [Xylona heveae TC161]|uniref:Very-long-chain (3R)-3-hydroxyacyl-CoA dehydratase n=1 Tax=Xylona heveae (strain CBS 132557 / TC161) TaxID=1328760 RepID=A0A165JT78_XYLHT|nr:PTPLA-domain-containing protein [Xylona heveae TC161]KZF26593.1 PTPLA-domain-containing protein [Xylona heveae TC161]